MTTLLISGWNIGFQKIAFARLLRDVLGYSLLQAKAVTDKVLQNEPVEIQTDLGDADRLVFEISQLGVRCWAAVSQR